MFVLLYKLIPLVALDNRDFAYLLLSNKRRDNSILSRAFHGKKRTPSVADFPKNMSSKKWVTCQFRNAASF
ncbi:hypothetical protein [Methanosarcina sp.]|uniref:hypothetical protein n=1 Tax=Methanosarcina sp. TaxID=2213 RepID=UPI003C7275EB